VQPETKYARLGDDRIAYQVLGHGPPDLVLTFGFFSSVDLIWEDPGLALFHRRLASFSRLILFDRRGMGASDPPPLDPCRHGSPTLKTRPERTSALVLANASAKYLAADDYPGCPPRSPRRSWPRPTSSGAPRSWRT
jgi:hypothetical protein